MNDPLARWRRNPFFVLALPAQATRAEFERAGQKFLALLQIGAAGSGQYQALGGTMTRDADAVRQALAQLREPGERVVHELWASVAADAIPGEAHPVDAGWPEAERALDWKART